MAGGAAAANGQNPSAPAQGSTTGSAASTSSSSTGEGHQSAGVENKGTPSAGTPSSAIGGPVGTASAETAQVQNGHDTFQGCLSGDVNSYELKTNGKTYHLQGDTTSLKSLVGHQVAVTGEVFNGKAIQVNGARDLGSSCSHK